MDGDHRRPDPRPALLRRPPTWSLEHQRQEPERPGFNAWDDRVRTRQNIAAAAVVLLLGLATYHVMVELRSSSRILACIEAGHRNCSQPVIPGNGHR
ncbi:MAG: hypothetical protein K2X45_13665 [Phreatobacter sp.]|jgi:hypothetical protein|nr:hypothetical protein [Phreatobacter sp.]